MPKNNGFSLLEFLLAMSLMALLSIPFLSLFVSFETSSQNQHQWLSRDENLRLAPLLFSRYLSPAANLAWQRPGDGLRLTPGGLSLESDLEGGTEGFPDGLLKSPYERLALRRRGDQLQLRSGRGTFQPLLLHIVAFEVLRSSPRLLQLELTARTGSSGGAGGWEKRLKMNLYLWNFRENLFAEDSK